MCVPWPPTKSPSAIYIYIYLFLSSPPSISSIRTRDLSTSLVIIFREGTCKGNKGLLPLDNWFRQIFIFLPLFLFFFIYFFWLSRSNGVARKYTLFCYIYIYICTFENLHFGCGNWSLGRTTTCLPFYSRFRLFSEEMKFPSDGDLFTFAYLK